MDPSDEIREQVQTLLQPYILPREEAAYRRRILAAHLEACVRDGSLSRPLGLAQPLTKVDTCGEARGFHREYLEALNANISARADYERVKDELLRAVKSKPERAPTQAVSQVTALNPLEEHLVKIKLRRKQDRLRVVEKHIALLNQKPAASPTFLDPEEVLGDTRPLPDVPREVVEGLGFGAATGKADLKDLIDRLEKQVLRAKLLLKNEEKLLDTVKARSTVRPETVTEDAKLAALNATRTELINWMEAELSKVPGDETDDENQENNGSDGGATGHAAAMDGVNLEEQLSSIREKYARYLIARKSLLQLVAQQPQAAPPLPRLDLTTTDQQPQQQQQPSTNPATAPATYLLTPQLCALLSLSRSQKGLIVEKSHLNAAVSRQLEETAQLLDHLAEESNLLLHSNGSGSHSSARPRDKPGLLLLRGLGGPSAQLSTTATDSYSRVKPWASAADDAKIATLEAVAEKIEEGQVALEGSMGLLMEVEELLGGRREDGGDGGEKNCERGQQSEDSDIWLAEERPPAAAAGVGKGRKHTVSTTQQGRAGNTDLWSFLDGGLGLLKAGEE